jgi:hypothetical protein
MLSRRQSSIVEKSPTHTQYRLSVPIYIAIFFLILTTARSRPTVADLPLSELYVPGRTPIDAGQKSGYGKSRVDARCPVLKVPQARSGSLALCADSALSLDGWR